MQDRNETPSWVERLPLSREVETEIVPELTHPELFALPVQGWPASREGLIKDKSNQLLRVLARVIDRQSKSEAVINVPYAVGRGGFLWPFVFRMRPPEIVSFTNLYLKGNGIANVDSALPYVWGIDIGGTRMRWERESPIFDPVRGDGTHEVQGMMVLSDAKLDGEKSLTYHHLGIRARLPVATFKLKKIKVGGELISLEDLVTKGWPIKLDEDNWPVISVWARRNPFTFRDITSRLNEANLSEESYLANDFFQTMRCFLRFENEKSGRDLVKIKDPRQFENRYFLWMSAMYGRQMAIFRRHGITHGMLTNQNISVGVEFADNSTGIIAGSRFGKDKTCQKDRQELHFLEKKEVFGCLEGLRRKLDLFRSINEDIEFVNAMKRTYELNYRIPIAGKLLF